MMAPEAATEAMKAYIDETNRLNFEHRVLGATDRKRDLETRQGEIAERLAAVSADIPDIHGNIAIAYRRRVYGFAWHWLTPRPRRGRRSHPRHDLRIVLAVGEMHAALRGDVGNILE